MCVLFPTAQVRASIPAMIGLGSLVGMLSGFFGVGGGFLLTPLPRFRIGIQKAGYDWTPDPLSPAARHVHVQ